MPIQGMTTNETIAFPGIGQLRKGAPKPTDGKAPGKDLPYFRFTTSDARAASMFLAEYGKEPNAIKIVLPFPNLDDNFSAFREAYIASRLVHRCDGVVVWERSTNGVLAPTSKPCPTLHLPKGHKDKCKPMARLRVIIPSLARFAYVDVLTTSEIDIRRLTEHLGAIRSVAGRLNGIPLVLTRREEEISMPTGKGDERRRVKKWMLHLEIDPEFAERRLLAEAQTAMMIASNPNALALPAPMPRIIDSQTGEIFDSFPDTNKDCYAGLEGYHPNMDTGDDEEDDEDDFDEAEAEIEAAPPVEQPAPEPAPAPIADLTIQERRAYVKRLTALWKEESDLGGERPDQEHGLDFQAMNKADFMQLGGAVKKRIQALRELLATDEPAE